MTTTAPAGATTAVDAPERRLRVVVGIDGSTGARSALRAALLEAGRRDARLEVVSAYPVDLVWAGEVPLEVPDLEAVRRDTRARAQGFLDEVLAELLVEEMPGLADVPVQLVVAGGSPVELLVGQARDAELLVVGSRGRGAVRSTLLGSVALHCVTSAPCPVVVVHGSTRLHGTTPARVVVGIDGSDTSAAALREAVGQAAGLQADVDVVVACSPADYWTDMYALAASAQEIRERARQEAEEIVTSVTAEQSAAGRPVPRITVQLVEGPPRQALLECADGAAVLVVGSSGGSAIRGLLLGSVALHCVIHAPCPVTVVHLEDRPALATPEPAAARG